MKLSSFLYQIFKKPGVDFVKWTRASIMKESIHLFEQINHYFHLNKSRHQMGNMTRKSGLTLTTWRVGLLFLR